MLHSTAVYRVYGTCIRYHYVKVFTKKIKVINTTLRGIDSYRSEK